VTDPAHEETRVVFDDEMSNAALALADELDVAG
jgi:hypothetical protein